MCAETTCRIKTIGTGDHSVYLYYFPAYRKVAENLKEDSWLCRIGVTSGDPENIDLDLLAGDSPERPEIALVIKTDDMRPLMRVFDDVLKSMCKKPGYLQSGWYITSPDELEDVYNDYSPLIGYDPVKEDVDDR